MATVMPPAPATADPLDVARPDLYRDARWQWPFARLRREGPSARLRREAWVYRCADAAFGPCWSVLTSAGAVEVDRPWRKAPAAPYPLPT